MSAENLSADLLAALDSFNREERKAALHKAVAAQQAGKVAVAPATQLSNVHAHTIHSYSTFDYSPSRVVWEALRRGLSVIGSTDFDVLDAMEEMFEAGDALGIRATVSLETRTFVDSYADREINSPGEPGVMYVMGAGFTKLPPAGSAARKLFDSLAAQSRRRNIEMVEKVNGAVKPANIDYEKDVLPLTPSGNATERHICAAYDQKSRQVFSDPAGLAQFWAGILGLDAADAQKLLADTGKFRNAIRAKLMKRGGVGYAQPDHASFPAIKDFFAMVRAANAVPCLAWLDGSTGGEADPNRLCDDAMAWGARIANIIPERNWNFADPEIKKKKLAALDAFVQACRKRNLPIIAGTEMNSPGQKFVDSFEAPELAPYVADFMDGAYWLFGHTVMNRLADMGAVSAWAENTFKNDWVKANAFYGTVGKKAAPDICVTGLSIKKDATVDEVLALFA